MNQDAGRRSGGWETALGGLLVLLGLVVLGGQALDLEVGRVAWPVFVLVPGLGLLGLGLATSGRVGEVLAMVGGVVTMAGLVLGSRTPPTGSRPGPMPEPWWSWSGRGSGAGWWEWCAATVIWPEAAPG
jgi:hypothetical protein